MRQGNSNNNLWTLCILNLKLITTVFIKSVLTGERITFHIPVQGWDFVLASTGGLGPELAHKTLESQFHVSLLTTNDAFFIIEDLWVQIVMSINVRKFK
ncbi:hypothetical protein AVEN_11253-1 [Araneus ventricosus]|uniref:Uncharacterized protein n=1 Tax=Araneus ventricosus TaxID=182803 RepID=A0A4Y2MAB6_ARAVE|nr:hypothetical protein AVEN_11253-1 [Araneus ventricosus]